MIEPVDVFVSYSPKDEAYCNTLTSHLTMLQKQGVIRSWHEGHISGGEVREEAIAQNLDNADIILLLISADFLASDYWYETVMKKAMVRHEAREATVIPIILRPVDLKGVPFEGLQMLPKNEKPVTKWTLEDEAFVDIVRGIRQAVENYPSQSPLSKGGSRPAEGFDPNGDFHVVLPDEGRCNDEIHKPGALIRIKSPDNRDVVN